MCVGKREGERERERMARVYLMFSVKQRLFDLRLIEYLTVSLHVLRSQLLGSSVFACRKSLSAFTQSLCTDGQMSQKCPE